MAHLEIYKDDGMSRINLQPTLEDSDRVLDIMMWLETESKKIPKQEIEYHYLFSLMEVKMIRDYLTNLINEYERLNAT